MWSMILAIPMFVIGCKTAKGIAEDIAWLFDTTSKNINPE
jgi:hypothetical protein